METKRGKVVNDPVHGHIVLPHFSLEIVDTPQFQRLRDLKQLGTTYYVFPGASHNRFEHCLGVSHLAGKLLNRLKKNQPELDITSRDIQLVMVAGLCHDLGHGPFSHSFEEWVERMRPETKWHHEAMSQKMTEYLINDNQLDYSTDDVKMIQDLISGTPSTGEGKEKMFLFDIVANMRNSVDVDKFDYLARDCLNLGIKSSYDSSRLMKYCRVINNQICYHSKEVYNVYEVFHTRYSMHKQVYSHRAGKAIEYMISDAFRLADPYLKISESIDQPEIFCHLTDSILHTIESSKEPQLSEARAIIRKIRTRNLYKFADEVLIRPERWKDFANVTEEEIVSGSNLKADDVILQKLTLNYAMQSRNPVDNVRFFTKWNETESFTIPREDVSMLLPSEFSENFLRIFVRDPSKRREAQETFRKFLQGKNYTPSPVHAMPKTTQSPEPFPLKKRRLDFEK